VITLRISTVAESACQTPQVGEAVVEGREPEGVVDHVQDGPDMEGNDERYEQRHRQYEAARGPAVQSLAQEPS
jgi:hypothetical protein